jgi:3D (Asp-Asp-Asp) domain-containing protein
MLRIDLYTKAVLTVIAACLSVLCFQSLHAPASAYAQSATSPQRVVIAAVDPQVFRTAVPVFISGGSVAVPVNITGASKPVPVTMGK